MWHLGLRGAGLLGFLGASYCSRGTVPVPRVPGNTPSLSI